MPIRSISDKADATVATIESLIETFTIGLLLDH
jgi:hypothetical protein